MKYLSLITKDNILYFDIHGHFKQKDAFMYGCFNNN